MPTNDLTKYDRLRDYAWNYENAPAVSQQAPSQQIKRDNVIAGNWTFCGLPVDSPIGISAGPLLNSNWLLYYAMLGFDILTYKTTRSRQRDCYPTPNLLPVEDRCLEAFLETQEKEQNAPEQSPEVWIEACETMQRSWAISFGMPSMPPEVWQKDVEYAKRRLPTGKLLSVSVVATPEKDWSNEILASDYARCARWAKESGADCVEVNFSCPNVASCDGQLFQNPPTAAKVCEAVREAISDTPLIIKIGYTQDALLARDLLTQLAPSATAFSMTNCIPAKVSDKGLPQFHGEPRGIGGAAILSASVAQIGMFKKCIDELDLAIKLIGVGGIFGADDVVRYLDAGAESTQMATAAMLDPGLATTLKKDMQST